MIKNYRVSAALLTAALVINSCAVFAFADDEVTESGGTVVEEAVSETTEAPEETPDEATDKAPADAPEETPAESTAETPVAEPANTDADADADADDVLAIAGGKVRTFDSAESDSNANVGYGTAGTMGGTGPFSGRRGFHIFGKSNGSLKRVTDQYGFLSFIETSKTPLAFRNSYSGSGLEVLVDAELKSDYVLITYKVVNTGTSDISINLGSIGEIMLDNESKVPMSVNGNCLLAYDSDNSIALAVMPDDGSFATRWIGSGSSIYSQFTYGFEDTTDTDYNTGSSKYSAGMSWSFDVDVPAGETVTKGVRFYAGDIDVVKITFDGNGGEGEMTDQVVFGGSPAKLHENKFTKADHKFKGWALSSTAKTVDYGDKESVSGLTSDTKLYAVWKENPTPTITAKDLKFTYGDTGSKVGASTNGDGALSYSVTSGDDVISVDSDGNITILQAGDAKIKISSAATSDYKATSKTINVTVDKKSVDITIDDASKDWGSDDPVFTYTKSVDGCSLEGMPAREEGEDVGEYDIKAGSLAVARGSSTNYKLGKITKGKFTINEVSVDVTIDYCDGEAPEVVPSSSSIPLKVYLERKADSKTYEGRTIVGWYTDADYTTEYDSSVPLGKTPIKLYAKWGDVSYSFTEGEDSVWTQGSDEGLTFKASRNVGDEFTFGHFKGVKVDGDELDASDYTAESGSVIVTLGVDFLTDLDVGTHTITLMFDDADDIEASFKVKAAKEDEDDDDDDEDTDDSEESAQTGDSASPIILIAAAILVAGGAVAVFFALKKRPEKN